MSDKITIQNPGAGLYLIVNLPKSMTCDWLIEKAAEQGVKVYSTARFWQDKLLASPNTLFLGFSLIELENIPDCVSRLKKAWFDK